MTAIQFTRRGLRDIRKLSPETRRETEVAFDQLLEDPRSGDPLHGEWRGYWKLRARDYRIIYRISGDTVEVQYVRHRREAYRKP